MLHRARRDRDEARLEAHRVFLEPDPDDPIQGIDEVAAMHVDELGVEAQTLAEAEAARDLAVTESVLDDAALDPTLTEHEEIDTPIHRADAGELYGAHQPPAVDRELPDDDSAQDEGENWIEVLNASSIEYGPEPERRVDPIDTADEPPHPSDTRDLPVADKGSGGVRGL